jgi:hypothetical protein
MPFDNFYEESDKSRRRWWKYFGLAFLMLTGYWAFALLVLPDFEGDRKMVEEWKRRESETEGFNRKERARRVDDLCRYLPKPEKFEFIRKDLPTDFSDSTSIVYRYASDRSPEEIMPFFVIWFNDNGWKSFSNDEKMFIKNKQMISIRALTTRDVVWGYEIGCYDSAY